MKKHLIAPSILSANFARLGEEVNSVLKAGADLIHFDVMDNHFVPNLTVGPMVCQALRHYGTEAPIDVHLMVQPVDDLIIKFAQAGATYITFHPEASKDTEKSLELIIDHGCKAGLAFNPEAPIDCLEDFWHKLDMIVLMSVNPGFGGQKFIPEVLNKITKVKDLVNKKKETNNHAPLIEVDGGINLDTIKNVADAGADIFVMGSAIFNYQGDYKEIIDKIREKLGV